MVAQDHYFSGKTSHIAISLADFRINHTWITALFNTFVLITHKTELAGFLRTIILRRGFHSTSQLSADDGAVRTRSVVSVSAYRLDKNDITQLLAWYGELPLCAPGKVSWWSVHVYVDFN